AHYSSPATAALRRLILPYLLLLVGSAATARARVASVVALAAGGVVVEAVEAVEVAEVAVGVVAGVGASVAAVVAAVGEVVAVVAAVGVVEAAVVAVRVELFRGEVLAVARGSSSSSIIGARPLRPSSFTCRTFHTQHRCFSHLDDASRTEFGDKAKRPLWPELLRSGVDIFALDYDDILAAMYALSVSAEGNCYLYVPPNLGIEAAALGASESSLPGTAPAEALHTFTLDSGASHCFFRDSTTLTPLSAPVPIRLADPLKFPVLARSSTVLPCLAVPSGSLSGLHLPSFSTNLVNTTALQDAMVTTTTPGGQRVSICTCTRTGRRLATFTHRPGSSLYTLTTKPPQVAASTQVSASGPVADPCLCCLLLHQNLLWHHRLGPPSLPRLHGMHSRLLVFGLPRLRPPLTPSLAPPCLPCVERQQRAAPHSSSFPLTTAPQQTHHMDVWSPARVSGQNRERYFLLVVDDYTRYTTVSLIGGEFSSDLLRDFYRGEGILQSFMLPASPQQNGVVERRIGLVMEVARTSMIHAAAPHFLWPFATSPTLRWTGKVGDASVFRVWGSRTFVRDPSADKLSSCAILCGPAPSGVSQVDPLPLAEPFEVIVDSGPARGAASKGAKPASAEPGGAEPGERPATRGAGAGGAGAGGPTAGGSGAGGAGATSPRGAGVTARAGGTGGAGATGSGGARTRVLELPELVVLEALELDTLELETLELEALALEALELEELEMETLALEALELEALALEALEVEALELETLELKAMAVETLEQEVLALGPDSPLLAPSPYAEQSNSLTERREHVSCHASYVRTTRTGCHFPRPRPPLVPDTHIMALRPSSVPLRVPLPSPFTSSLADRPDPESDLVCAANPTVPRLLATVVTDPWFESAAASALVVELVGFVAACRLDYATSLVAESESDCPPSVGGERAPGTDVLEDMQEDIECLAAAVPHLVDMLLAPERDPDAPDIPTPCSYAEAITGPYSSKWQTAMDAEMASWKSTGTYVDAVPPPGANIVDGMWIFMVKRPPVSPPVFKARYSPRKWHDTLRMTLAALGFTPSTTDPLLFLRTDTSLTPFYVLVYIDDFDFASAETEALALVKSELQKRHTCTDLGELRSYLDMQITQERARRTITLTLSHMVHQDLQRFGFRYSSPRSTPLPTDHSLSAPPSDESVEPCGPYLELVGCLMVLRYLCSTSGMGLLLGGQGLVVLGGHADASWIYAGAMAAQELRWLTYLLTDLGERPHSSPVLYIDNKAMIALCQEHRLEHRTKHIALRYFLAPELQQRGQLCLAYVATRANTADIFTKALQSETTETAPVPSALGSPVATPAAPPAALTAAPTPTVTPSPAAPVPPVRAPPGSANPAAPAPAAPPAAPAPAAPPVAPAPAAPPTAPVPAAPPAVPAAAAPPPAPAPAAPPAAPAPAAPPAAPALAAPPAALAPAAPVARQQRRAYHSRSRCGERDSRRNWTPGEPPDSARAGSAPPDSTPPDSTPPGSIRSGSAPPDSTRSGSAPPVSAPPGPAPAGSAPLAAPESTATSTGSAEST
ncbi:unnamed protein product, partial [Closterium sp. NIES-54]